MVPRPPNSRRRSAVRIRVITLTAILCAVLAAVLVPLSLLSLPEPRAPHEGATPADRAEPSQHAGRSEPTDSVESATTIDVTSDDAAASNGRPAPDDDSTAPPTGAPHAPAAPTSTIARHLLRSTAPPPSTFAVTQPARPPHSPREAARLKQRSAVERFGGNRRTEDAVEAGLAWLAAHQDADGMWDRFYFNRHCPSGDPCAGHAIQRTGPSLDAGVTGLALLAFLGAGYTDADGPYRDVVARAVDALARSQQSHGGFSADAAQAGYNDSLATFALAEYVSLTGNEKLLPALRKAVERLSRSQQRLGGWDYLPRADRGRNDTSITAWAIQALTAAQAAGVAVRPETLCRAAVHLARATEEDGRVWYADSGTGFDLDEGSMRAVYRYGPAMTAAAVVCKGLLGWRMDSPILRTQRALLSADPPSEARMVRDTTSLHSYYYWYYGTIAMFQAGGAGWERWNAALRDAILPLQERSGATGRGHHRVGSWPPYGKGWGKWGRMGGRVYSTALCVLTLETYYRHLPAYLADTTPMTAGAWRATWPTFDARIQRWAVEALEAARVEIGEPLLVDLLDSEDERVAVEAAMGLVEFDSPLGMRVLEDAARRADDGTRAKLSDYLRRARSLRARVLKEGEVRIYDGDRRLATLSLSPAYVGLRVQIRRGERRIAEMRVIQRFADRDIVVAELVDQSDNASPQAGDRVVPVSPGGPARP
ncbi:MAG: hypothetical protein D6744_06870 [Planctomycetota bacterium]|nr:MAG: hypothetical protein D6744_06870 [Planctomycetota bacterium]